MPSPIKAMIQSPPYDPANIFAKILAGEIPSQTIFEDEHTKVIMDVMPQADGHALVIPKAPSRNLLDADPASLGHIMAVAQKIAIASLSAFDADGVTVQQFNEAAGGQSVFHLHVHVIPRHEGVTLRGHAGGMADPDLLAEHAERYRSVLG
ncbi:MAG: HIT family protein [Pseudomonadota bacterium]